MPHVLGPAIILAGYALGCITLGYYVVRLRAGYDVRTRGSGSAGARNVGRMLGTRAALITFLGDFAKGAIAVWAARAAGLDPWVVSLVMLAVVTGHIWPVQLHFKGGKGISTVFGAGLVFDYRLVFLVFIVFLISFLSSRRFTLSGLIGIVFAPFAAMALHYSPTIIASIGVTVLVILFAHRTNLTAIAKEMQRSREKWRGEQESAPSKRIV